MELKQECVEFIGHEEIEAFNEVRNMCFFGLDKKAEKAFWIQVLHAGKCGAIHEMHFDNFETAYTKARSILCKRGQEIFKKKIA